jgi:uncharacterized membrane protein
MLAKFFWWNVCWLTVPLYRLGIRGLGLKAFRRYERAAMKLEDSLR